MTLAVHDPDQAQALSSQLYYPQNLVVLDRDRKDVTMSVWAAQIGPIFLGELSYDADVRIDCGELNTSYHVNVPLRGRLATTYRGLDEIATPARAAVYGPVGQTLLSRWEAGSRQLCVKIDKNALENTLARHLRRELAGPVSFDPALDLRSPSGRGWADLVTMVSDQLHNPGSLIHQPLVGAPLVDGLINGLLTRTTTTDPGATSNRSPARATVTFATPVTLAGQLRQPFRSRCHPRNHARPPPPPRVVGSLHPATRARQEPHTLTTGRHPNRARYPSYRRDLVRLREATAGRQAHRPI
ncbi:MAG TPA: hypothetical protein VGH89_42860 [Pseudonocardia sp.]